MPSKIKPIRTGKKLEQLIVLITHNFKPQEVKMKNKVLRERSNGVVC